MVADTLYGGTRKIVEARQAGGLSRSDERIRESIPPARALHAERPITAVIGIGATLEPFGFFEIRQHIFIRPAGRAGLPPQRVIQRKAADIDHAVHGAGAAYDLALQQRDLAAFQARHRLGNTRPHILIVKQQFAEAKRNFGPGAAVLRPGFQQQHLYRRVLGQTGGHNGTGRA